MVNTVHTAALLSEKSFTEIINLGNNVYELVQPDKNLIIEVLSFDIDNKSISIRHCHTVYSIVFKNELDVVLDKMGIKRNRDVVSKDIKAPMPGKVIEVISKVGDHLSKGDGVLILEAMKMENVIKAEADCVVKKILVSDQDNVEKNQILIELEAV